MGRETIVFIIHRLMGSCLGIPYSSLGKIGAGEGGRVGDGME
jgi:hypothetical protein